MTALRATDLEWRPSWERARAAWRAEVRRRLQQTPRTPLLRALLTEIATQRRWRRYAEAERVGLLLALQRRDATILGLRAQNRELRAARRGSTVTEPHTRLRRAS